jgi:hypothetical protein
MGCEGGKWIGFTQILAELNLQVLLPVGYMMLNFMLPES